MLAAKPCSLSLSTITFDYSTIKWFGSYSCKSLPVGRPPSHLKLVKELLSSFFEAHYASINFKYIIDKWSYITEVVSLLVYTYQNANRTIRTLKEDKDIIEGYIVSNFAKEELMCPCAKTLINKKYSKTKPPRIPYHIGCNCELESTLDFED